MLPAIRAIPTSGTYLRIYHGMAGYKPTDAKYSGQPDGADGLDSWNHRPAIPG